MEIGRDQDEHGRRWYYHGDSSALSVTTILQELEEDTSGLDWWKKNNDGTGNNAHWLHLFWYKTYRGTLCHYQALVHFEDSFESEDAMWGGGEAEAMGELIDGSSGTKTFVDPETGETIESTADEILYSILKDHGYVDDWYDYNKYYSDHSLLDIHRQDQEWFVEAFHDICGTLDITDDNIVRVEQFMLNDDIGYGGQCDMLYRDNDGNLVVVDLKTSSGLRHKHRLQAIAYAKAVERDFGEEVSRVEVWRIHPDSKEWVIHTHDDVSDNHTTKYWYKDQYGNFEYESNDEMWEQFCLLTGKAYEVDDDYPPEERLMEENV